MAFLHGPLVGVVDQPALLQDLGADPLGLLDRLHQPLQRDARLRGVGRQRTDLVDPLARGLARLGLVLGGVACCRKNIDIVLVLRAKICT